MTKVWSWFRGTKISDAASLFQEILKTDEVGNDFRDSFISRFVNFDEHNANYNNTNFTSDVKYIAKCTLDDISSGKTKTFQRIDAYFYVYYRLVKYSKLFKQNDSFLQDYQKTLLDFLTKIFKSTDGKNPNLLTKDQDLLKEMNIIQHLSSIKIDSEQKILTAFVLFKLSIQSSMIINENEKTLTWKHILSSLAEIRVCFEDFIEQYIKYETIFRQCPFDMSAYIYLIQLKLPRRYTSKSPFATYSEQSQKLKFNDMAFFQQFQPIFEDGLAKQLYKTTQINELLILLSTVEQLFSEYLTIYATNVIYDQLWSTFISLSRFSNLHLIIQKHLGIVLTKNISSVSFSSFKQYIDSAKVCVDNLSIERKTKFLEIFEQFYDAFVAKEMRNLAGYKEQEIKALMNIDPSLLPIERRKKPANSLIIQQLIFRIDPPTLDTPQKIMRLFRNISEYNNTILRNSEPSQIIDNESLKDFTIGIPQIWLKFDENTYRYLCNYHQNNPWTIYIWSQIVNLSVLKVGKDNLNTTLVQLNDWMKTVRHDVYNPNDILTIIFVKNLFEFLIMKYSKHIVSLPNIELIVKFVISMKDQHPDKIDEFIQTGSRELESILQLKGMRTLFRKLLTNAVIRCFLPYVDIKKVLSSVPPVVYQFPRTSNRIDAIITLPKPGNLDIKLQNSREDFFDRFIYDINQWFPWFDRFFDVFQPILDWLKTYNINRVNQLALDLSRMKSETKITVIQLKTTVEEICKVLQPFNDLERLCHLFNCLISFRIIEQGVLNNQINIPKYIKELERFQPTNTFRIEGQSIVEHKIPIQDHQNVRWSLISTNHPCTIKVEYRIDDIDESSTILYEKVDVPIQKNVLQGQFETEKPGQLIITINNRQRHTIQIWYRVRSVNLSTCHLFHGILRMIYEKYYPQSNQVLSEDRFSKLVDETFLYIDKLLNGDLTLRDMTSLQAVFCNKNIHIKDEVEKFFTSRSNEQINHQEIEQVCEWLQIYQYYSHITIIIDCIRKFDIISNDNEDETIGNIQRLGGNDNCTLREISQAYRILQQCFKNLTHQHLQLIRTAVECSNVVQMLKKADLYSDQGRSRFLKLRDNLTTQFQLQERNNMILNSWIITYSLLEPFMSKVNKFDDFLAHIARLPNLEDSSLNHIKIINDNLQIVNMWLSAEDTTVLDNALIVMENLYRNGVVDIRLRHLINESSYFEIGYSFNRNQDQTQEAEQLRFTLSMSDIDDHKRQLAFCNVDIQQNRLYSKTLIECQLKLLQKIEKIYSILKKLEISGHPDFQLREEHYDIYLYTNSPNPSLAELEQAAKQRSSRLDFTYGTFEQDYSKWIKNLDNYRQECSLLKLFSNRQIMILIILLQQSPSPSSIRRRFLEKLYPFQNRQQNDEEQQFTLLCLKHYLSSIKIQQKNDLNQIYEQHKVDANAASEVRLQKLAEFLKDLFNNGNELMEKRTTIDTDQQYLIPLNVNDDNLDINTFCILINLLNNRLPSSFQILWCTTARSEDIKLFFSRIRTFRYLIFIIIDIDKMHHRLREILLSEQDCLTRDQVEFGTIFYFSKELTTSRNGFRAFTVPPKYRNVDETSKQLISLFQKNQLTLPSIKIVYGTAGVGKTHRINTENANKNLSCFSINDNLNLSSLIRSFLLFNSQLLNTNPLIYFNISVHAPFDELNRTLFSLFICGSLMDSENGLIFSLPNDHPWEFVVEVPYSEPSELSYKENFSRILPLLSIITSKENLEEVNGINYQLHIGDEEELVARFLKAYADRTIDRLAHTDTSNVDHPVEFDPLTNIDECRRLIYNCMTNYAPELPRNKICELSFTKFLYRRIRFFIGHFFQWNQDRPKLGSIAMKQMIEEAKLLTKINFRDDPNPYRVFLVYDSGFALHLLHNDWNCVSTDLKEVFSKKDPRLSPDYHGKDYLTECLAWLINISYTMFETILLEKKFILTENFAYKLFHVHERKLTCLPLIIEGDTGVGKTFLLKFYSELLTAKNTQDHPENTIVPRIAYNMNKWLLDIIVPIVENQEILLKTFVHQTKRKILGLENNDENNLDPLPQQVDLEYLNEIKRLLGEFAYKEEILHFMWKTILTISNENRLTTTDDLIGKFYEYVGQQLIDYRLIESSNKFKELLEINQSPTIQLSIELCEEYLFHSQIKPIFYRLLLHPGITDEQIVDFMNPIIQLARELPVVELVVFFDEVNTSSCLGLFKEMFMDGTLHGKRISKNIFFTAAINPYMEKKDEKRIHRNDFNVYKLPQSLENLVVPYGALTSSILGDYISRKIAMFQINSTSKGGQAMPLDNYVQQTLSQCILAAQAFCETRLGANTVSQREIQRCFSLIEFFWRMRYDDEIENGQITSDPNPIRCIALSLALIYYFRLPTKEHIKQEELRDIPSREELAEILSEFIPEFDILIQNELSTFVNTNNFTIPAGVAINQAVREHIFAIVVSIVTGTPLCIIGVPGQSKTLSFQIVLQNLQGAQLSPKPFCKRLPAVDPFFCMGSKYTKSDDIAYVFERAIKREHHYKQNGIDTRCVVFLDEASLPDERKMVLKVLHPYLDDCKVAFVAIANQSFDAANANRMICIYRSLPSKDDQKILAYGCLGLDSNQNQFDDLVTGLCQGYRSILQSKDIPRIFHDRDFIYTLRELRFELTNTNEEQTLTIGEITPTNLLRALEDNFQGIKPEQFNRLVKIFFQAVNKKCENFILPNENTFRDIPTILRQSMKLDSKRRKLYGRYKLVIDESEDESAVQLLFQSGILSSHPEQTTIFRMSDFPDDIENELRNVEILSTIKLCMETGKTILMVNTGRIHGALYDVFNQNFSIMATDETRKIFSKVAIGPKTMDVCVHENFQCIVHVKRSEFDKIPAPFLSRFQKYILNITDFYSIHLKQIPRHDQQLMQNIEARIHSFIQHFGRQYFYGLNDSTLYSCLLSLIRKDENGQNYLTNIHQNYSQLTIKSKSFIEQNSTNNEECILYYLLSQLIQLVSPESMIYKLRTFDGDFARLLYKNYFHQQEHFDIEKFINQILSYSLNQINENDDNKIDLNLTRKFMLFTRTSTFVTSLNENSKNKLFQNSDRMDIINLSIIENSAVLNEQLQNYAQNEEKQVLIIIVDGRIRQQRLHISFLRQLIDKIDQSLNKPNEILRKYFLILVHSTSQELNHQLCFPSIFLHNWDYHFLDTSTSGSAFHLQKSMSMLTTSYHTPDEEQFENLNTTLCDYNRLFNDCLWDFCSRIQIFPQNLSLNMFSNEIVREFYQRETGTLRRVECLQQILQQSTQLQERIVNIYYENMTINQKTFETMKNSMYKLSKDVLCGKRTNSLVDSFQSQIRSTFMNFISNILKHVVNDYGLETLSKLSHHEYGYEVLLNLIDYSSFAIDDENENDLLVTNQGYLTLTNHYSCILQTPLYHLFHQRIKTLAEQIKPTVPTEQNDNFEIEISYERDNNDDDDDDDEFFGGGAPTTMGFNQYQNIPNKDEKIEFTSEQYRDQLIELILTDKILVEIVSESILKSYTNDTVRTFCTVVEKSFKNNNNPEQCQKTVEFVANWLLLIDDDDQRNLENSSNSNIWLLAHVYTFFEYNPNDLYSLYSACRTIDQLDPSQSFYEDILKNAQRTRSSVRESIFRLMFNYLWKNLYALCSTDQSSEPWIQSYTFISKYYPSEKVLEHQRLTDVKGQIEFMNLAYLIFLNNQTPEPKQLVLQLLNATSLNENELDGQRNFYGTSVCLRLLSPILNTIEQYLQNQNLNNSTLMIDIQQWILLTVKSSSQSSEKEIKTLLEFLDQPTCQLSLSMKQFLFDELMNLLFTLKRQNRVMKQNPDFWDRLILLPFLVECVHEPNLQTYQLPYHSSMITDENQKEILFDLFFFHLRRLSNDEILHPQLLNTILMSKSPPTNERRLQPMIEKVFQQLKDFFSISMTALLFSEKDLDRYDQQRLNQILDAIIRKYLTIDPPPVIQLSSNLQLFLSIIITKRSWNHLLNLLQSEFFLNLNSQWSNTLHSLLQVQQTQQNPTIQTCHRLQFTLTTNTTLSNFPKLHPPYDELSKLVLQCSKLNDAQRWKPLTDWITLKLAANPIVLTVTEIKVMLFLNIYYNFYCTNQLVSLENLITVIQTSLQPLEEELRVFQAFLQPEQSMIGYPRGNNNVDNNQLNNLFKLDCKDEDELNIRHALVNLLAMILLAGKQNFLWTFTFQPLTLQNTFGFGSTSANSIQANGVHYDCGCVLTENGDLQQFGGNGGALSVPSVYVAYFSTFGAMALHLLLFKESVNNLYHPVLAKHAIDDTSNVCRIVGDSIRAKVCHFVRARLFATYAFLSIRTNESDACLLLNRCFEQLTNLTKPENAWIRAVYTKVDDKLHAEREYQNQIFYPTDQQIVEYKKFITNLYLQSQVQQKLQEYISQMPIIVQFQHFKTELCNPKYVNLPLNILRRTLDSFAFLRITDYIYDLGQFYILLHQTYTQLIKRDEFEMTSLQQLYERGQKRQKNSNRLNLVNQNQQHLTIIQNGIKAINAYHSFADGLIRPGACDETQRFTAVSIDTPISYLLTTEEHDEGDIIMRIMSVLIDYHNNMLLLLEKEINSITETHGITLLKDLINQFSLRELSLLQILQENTGVISINDQDRLAIEHLARSSLDNNNEYFLKSDTPLNFNFLYIQYYLIRSYFLLCPINYKHIHEKYRCYTEREITQLVEDKERTNYKVNDPQFEYLQNMSLKKLYQGYKFLENFVNIPQVDARDLTFYELLQRTDNSNGLFKQIKNYEIRDFQFLNIKNIFEIYQELINNFHYSILNSSHLLCMPISAELNRELDESLNVTLIQSQKDQDLQSIIGIITEFLDELKDLEDTLSDRTSQPLMSVYRDIYLDEDSIFNIISKDIKCEHYVAVIIKLIEIRSKLQEKTIQIEEVIEDIWRPIVTKQQAKSAKEFDLRPTEVDTPILRHGMIPFPSILTLEPPYTILFELNLESVPLTSPFSFEEIRDLPPIQMDEQWNFKITYLDKTTEEYSCEIESLQNELKKIFQEKNYDFDQFGIIDNNQIFIDLTIENNIKSCLSNQYYVIERNSLSSITIDFEENTKIYFAIKNCRISSIINRFLHDQNLSNNNDEVIFAGFDQFGIFIKENQFIEQYSHLKLVQYDIYTRKLSKLTLKLKEDFEISSSSSKKTLMQLFDRNTTWEQISHWIQIENILPDISIENLQYWNGEAGRILVKKETISSISYDFTSVTIDGFTRETLVDILLSYNNQQETIRLFNSTPINCLLTSSKLISRVPLNDCILSLIRENETIKLNDNGLQKSVCDFLNKDGTVLHFQVSILIKLIQYDTQNEIRLPISNKNLSVKELLNLIDDQTQSLASQRTHMILSDDEKISSTKYFLVEQDQICDISIELNPSINQRFIIHSILRDIYQQNEEIIQDQYLVYNNHFIFSPDTSLAIFRQDTTPIQFTLTNQEFPIKVTIVNEDDDSSFQFQCQSSISLDEIKQLSCQLFKTDNHNRYLVYEQDFILPDETFLRSLLQQTTSVQFNLIEEKRFTSITTVQNDTTVRFQCLPILSLKRIKQFTCQLLNIDENQHLVYDRNFILSEDTVLQTLLNETSLSIDFTLIPETVLINVIVTDNERDDSIEFQCLSSVILRNLKDFSVDLFNRNDDRQLAYKENFLLSEETSISCLQSTTPIQFTLTKQEFPITITVSDDKQKAFVDIQCLSSISLENLKQISCQLLTFNSDNENLVYENDFILSQEIFKILLQETSSIKFNIINQTYPANITITKDSNTSMKFQCLPSISFHRLRQFACQIFDLNIEKYLLQFADQIIQQNEICLADVTESFENIQLQLIENIRGPRYKPLFELNIQSCGLTATDLFKKIRDLKREIDETSTNSSRPARFEVIHPNGTRPKAMMNPRNIYPRLKTTFQEKNYDFDQYTIVDQQKIFVDFLSENNDLPTIRISTEYHIIDKTELIPVLLIFKSQQMQYLVTRECQISSIITRFLVDQRIALTSDRIFFGFFDQLKSYIVEDQSIDQIYRSNTSDPIRIELNQYENNTDNLYQVTVTISQAELQIRLFHQLTTLQQIDIWLRTIHILSKTYSFYDREQEIILDETQSISTTSSTVDGVSNNDIMTVRHSYETNTKTIRILKSACVSDLLNNKHYLRQLNVQISSNDCILVRIIDKKNEILSKENLEQTIETYSSSNSTESCFQIATLVQIIQYDTNELFSIPVPNRNLTIEQLIEMIPNRNKIYQYLSSFQTHLILPKNQILSKLTETKFHLINTNQILLIAIDDSKNVIQQNYANFATIADIYSQNREFILKQHLLFDEKFILSSDTPLNYFQQFESPIKFTTTDRNFTAFVTITNDEQQEIILKFHCSPSIEISFLRQFACRLLNVRRIFYELQDNDQMMLDDDLPLNELEFKSFDDIQLKLVCSAEIKCFATYSDRTVMIPTNKDTDLQTILEESLEKFFIPKERMNNYKLFILDTSDNPEEVDLEFKISDVLDGYAIQSNTIKLQLTEN